MEEEEEDGWVGGWVGGAVPPRLGSSFVDSGYRHIASGGGLLLRLHHSAWASMPSTCVMASKEA